MEEYAVKLLEEVLKIYSPSGQEELLSQLLAERMENLGFDVEVDKVKNVIGTIGSGSPSILLCGHMDTVPGIQPVRVADGLIFGRGSVDAKSSLTAMLMAASKFVDKTDFGKVIVAGVVDEEGKGRGVRELIKDSIKVDYAIFGEPSGIEQITIGYKGRISLIITCKTASVHASAPWMSQNAIEKAFEVWDAIRIYALQKEDKNSRFDSLTACITKIKGGTAHNILPGTCRITTDIRIPTKMSCTKVYQDIMGIIKEYQSDVSFPKIDVKVGDMTEPFETDKNSPLVRALIVAILKIRGMRPMLIRKTGTGDMNAFGQAFKIPVVTYGPGNPHLSHTHKEYIEISEYLSGIKIYQKVISNLYKFYHVKSRNL
ncbi:MAG: M20/M25/M40 family metallo-hydrolase [Candidatus Methylarchaceae archaeon HK02M1]|nr:M20/M25/M40 family metallo-hydrolase [Candidatus Methylarchaceae archaeon HK02M1]